MSGKVAPVPLVFESAEDIARVVLAMEMHEELVGMLESLVWLHKGDTSPVAEEARCVLARARGAR